VAIAVKYVALFAPDLPKAESFYCQTLGMEVRFRESEQDGTWRTLRPGLGWDDAESHGIEIGMVALRREELVLALFRGTPQPGTLYELCLGVSPTEIDAIRTRLAEDAEILESRRHWLRFRDPFGLQWAIQPIDATFSSSGEIAGRWID
jgi:catechol 2,3-dioxygenase-like lactoylglutathione lyase family enzyme